MRVGVSNRLGSAFVTLLRGYESERDHSVKKEPVPRQRYGQQRTPSFLCRQWKDIVNDKDLPIW